MGIRGTVILAMLVVATGLCLWLEQDRSTPPPVSSTLLGEPRVTDPSGFVPLLRFVPADIVAIEIQEHGEIRRTQRQDNGWSGAIAAGSIDDFLQNLASLAEIMEVSQEGDSVAEYGLDPASAGVILRRRSDPTPLRLELGNRNPATTGVYARIDGQRRIILAGALVTWEIEKVFKNLPPNSTAPAKGEAG